MRPIFRTALVAAVLMLAACGSATPDASRAPTPAGASASAGAPTAAAPAASTVNDAPAAPAAAPAQAQGKPRFIDFYATW